MVKLLCGGHGVPYPYSKNSQPFKYNNIVKNINGAYSAHKVP